MARKNRMGECCEKCKYYRVLEHNFKQGKGFEISHACVLLSDEYDSSVLEVSPQDMCEMFTEKLATNLQQKQIVSKLENAELARDSEVTCNNKQVTSKLVASEDAISRQAAIDAFSMFAEYESNRTNAEWVDRIRVVLSSLPSVTPNQVPCEDAISRQLVIKAIYDYNSLINIAQAVRELPPVQPIRSRGHWIFEEGDGKTCFDGYVCSACNKSFHTHVPYFAEYEFCPHCGADMQESEDKE